MGEASTAADYDRIQREAEATIETYNNLLKERTEDIKGLIQKI